MIFVLGIMGVFVAISIYFFFRAEKFQRDVILAKRETKEAAKEHKVLQDAMALVANRYEEFAKNRLEAIAKNRKDEDVEFISLLIHNYSTIYFECLQGKNRLKPIVEKCLKTNGSNAYTNFELYLNKSDKQIQRMWSSNNLNGFISLVESVLADLTVEK